MIDTAAVVERFERDGRAWLREVVPPDELRRWRRLASLDGRPGARIPPSNPLFDAIANSTLSEHLKALWPEMLPVRLVSFNKSPSANWGVPWHQDRVISVERKADLPGYSNWSRKSGIWHCEPPAAILESMFFVRVHLDRHGADNGAMEIALGSHRAGKVAAEAAASVETRHRTELAIAEPGDVLVLAMLTLHRSLPSISKEDRRVLRVDYARCELPAPLRWIS